LTPAERFRAWLTEYLDHAWARRTPPADVAEMVRRQGVLAGLDEREIIAALVDYGHKAGGVRL
jgi:hypothetical protein